MGEIITIPYKPREHFLPFHSTTKRWIVIVAHRRSGKTTATLNHLQRDVLRTPQSRWAYIAPTYKMAKNIAWDMIKQYSRMIPGTDYNEAELTVKYPNGSKLTLFGADNPNSLRGLGLWGVVFDEYSQQPSNIFTEIIRPALTDHNGYAIWIGTPKGKNEFYRLYQQSLKDEQWLGMLLSVEQTNIISQSELDDAKKIMSIDEFNQEFMCSFEASIKGAYYSQEITKARNDGRIKIVPYDPALKVNVVVDLGVGQALGAGFYQKSGDETRMIDYWEGSNQDGIPQLVKALQNKPYIYGKIFVPHDATAVSIDTGKTRVQTIKDLWTNAQIEIVPRMSVDDGISQGRLFWSHLWIDDKKCQQWIDYISQYKQEWDDKKGMFKEKPLHDFTSHAADVHRYASLVEKEMTNEDFTEIKTKPYEPLSEFEGGDAAPQHRIEGLENLANW